MASSNRKRTRILRLLVFFCFLLATPRHNLLAQEIEKPASRFTFPRFVASQDVSTGIAIFNPGLKEASVTLTLTGIDGYSAREPVRLRVPARGQIAKTAAELFDVTSGLDASLVVSSDSAGILATTQTFDSAGTFMEGIDSTDDSLTLIYPIVPGPQEGFSEIDIWNPNSRPTSAELKLWSYSGSLLGVATVRIPAGGVYRNLAADIFPPGTSFTGASHITAAGKPSNLFSQAQTVSGTSLFLGFSSVAEPGVTVDLAAINALPLPQLSSTGVIPYFRAGGRSTSILALANAEPSAVDVDLTAINNGGVTVGTRRITLKANGGSRALLQSVFPTLASSEQVGWILMRASGRVCAAIIQGSSDAAALTAIPLQKTPKLQFVFPQIVQRSGMYTEISLSNPGSNTSIAEVFVIKPDGETVASAQVVLPPGAQNAQHLDSLLPEVTAQSGGYIYVRANEPLFAAALIGSDNGSLLTSMSPQSLSVSFTPSPRKIFAVSGKVTLNDRPASGFRINLSGPVELATTSAADGTYLFKNLPAGSYTLAIESQAGFLFVPSQVSFELKTASKQQDFQGSTGPNAIVVQPAALPVGSPDTALTVFGRDFNETSQVLVDFIRLKTTFVDSTQLKAIIPAYMLAAPLQFDIRVLSNAGAADEKATTPFAFVAYLQKPALTSVTAADPIFEGGPDTTLTLIGTGFLRDSRVKINGISDNIRTTLVSDTKIFAEVPARYFERGGIFPVAVENPYPAAVESNIQLLSIYFASPAVQEVVPGSVAAKLEPGSEPLNIEVLGYGFRRGATVLCNGQRLITTYCENDAYCLAVHLYAKIPASMLNQSGFLEISVRNPDPTLASSEKVFLRVEGLQPTITSVLPGSATALNLPDQFLMPIVVSGTNFGPQTSIRVYPTGTSTLPGFSTGGVNLLSSTQLYTTLLIDYASIGEWQVEVANPQPGGGQSKPVGFYISEGSFVENPFLIKLFPDTVPAGGPSFTLLINGTNFRTGARVQLNSTLLTTSVISDRQIQAVVPASLVRTAGRVPVSVINPDNGGASNRLYLDIR